MVGIVVVALLIYAAYVSWKKRKQRELGSYPDGEGTIEGDDYTDIRKVQTAEVSDATDVINLKTAQPGDLAGMTKVHVAEPGEFRDSTSVHTVKPPARASHVTNVRTLEPSGMDISKPL